MSLTITKLAITLIGGLLLGLSGITEAAEQPTFKGVPFGVSLEEFQKAFPDFWCFDEAHSGNMETSSCGAETSTYAELPTNEIHVTFVNNKLTSVKIDYLSKTKSDCSKRTKLWRDALVNKFGYPSPSTFPPLKSFYSTLTVIQWKNEKGNEVLSLDTQIMNKPVQASGIKGIQCSTTITLKTENASDLELDAFRQSQATKQKDM